jgi:hypothetical protein
MFIDAVRTGKIDDLKRLVQEANDLIAELEADLPEDIYAEGCVLVFTKPGRYADGFGQPDFRRRLKYAAIKAGGHWHLTGKNWTPKSWEVLLDFIGPENYPTIKTISQDYMRRPDWAKPDVFDEPHIAPNVRPLLGDGWL